MNRHARRLITLSLGAALAAHVSSRPARAHEEGVITLASAAVAVGDDITVDGADFAHAASYKLVLRGGLREYELGVVETDSDGRFSVQLRIPGDVQPGPYRLAAIAPDGDEAATAELEVGPARAETGSEPGAERMPTARADELPIERQWSGFEWFVVGILFGGALVGGAVLYRRPAR